MKSELMPKSRAEEHIEHDLYEMEARESRRWVAVAIAVSVLAGALVIVLLAGPVLHGKGFRFQKYKRKAAAYLAEREFARAISMYQRALALKPDEVGVRELLARSHLQNGDLPEAIAEYRHYLRESPDDVQAQLTLASLYLLARNLDRSKEILDSVLESQPDNVLALTMEAQWYYEGKDGSHPVVDASMITDILPPSASRYNLPTGPGSGETASATDEKSLLQAVEDAANKPDNIEARVQASKNLADFYRREKRFAEAEEQYKKMVEMAPRDAEVRLLLADFYRGEGIARLPEAIEHYSDILRTTDLKNLYALRGISGLSLATGRLAEAERYVDRLLWEQPSDAYGRYFRGILEVYDEEMARAESDFLFVTKEGSESPAHAHYLLGYTYLVNHEMGKAKKSMEEASRVEPAYGRPRLLLAEIALNLGEYKQALQTVEELLILEKWRDNPLVHLIQGRVHIVQNDPTRAEAPFTKLADLDKESVYPKLLLGEVYKRTAKSDQAVGKYQEATAAAPESAQPFYLLGLLYEKTGEPVLSITNYEKAVTRAPNFAVAARSLSEAYVRSSGGSAADAKALGETFLQRFPDNFTLLDTLGMVFYELKQFEKAVEVFELIPEEKRDARPEIVYHYAMALYRSARLAQAEAETGSLTKAREAAARAARRNAQARRELEKAIRWLRDLPKAGDVEETLEEIVGTKGISG